MTSSNHSTSQRSLTRPEVGTKGNFRPSIDDTRAPFLIIINELILKINGMVAPGLQRTPEEDERAALNENCQAYIKVYNTYIYVCMEVMMQKGANEA